MEIKIFDVSHSFCALVIADSGNVALFDCGHNQKTGFRPSHYLPSIGVRRINQLIIQNFDEDHVSDLPNVLQAVLIVDVLTRNDTVPESYLRRLKQQTGFVGRAMEAALGLHSTYTSEVTMPPNFASIKLNTFFNSYPLFTDINNLSVLSFIEFDGMEVTFTGDLEKAGWQELLKDYWVRSHLERTNIFIASHHGRESRY
jgi:beta-lactamase superfamily II metal-dependent hydrolase